MERARLSQSPSFLGKLWKNRPEEPAPIDSLIPRMRPRFQERSLTPRPPDAPTPAYVPEQLEILKFCRFMYAV